MLDTQQIMKSALRLAHFNTIPSDSQIHVKGRKLRRLLVAIDVGVSELLLAKNLDCDGVIAHHPCRRDSSFGGLQSVSAPHWPDGGCRGSR